MESKQKGGPRVRDKKCEVPFKVNLRCGGRSSELVADGIRQAILSGRYGDGDVLPNREEMAETLGVSVRAVRGAIAKLAAEGLVMARHKVGCVVRSPKNKVWRGHVLYVGLEVAQNSYSTASFLMTFRQKMSELNFLVSVVTFSHDENGVLRDDGLKAALARPFGFVVVDTDDRKVQNMVGKSGIPFLSARRDHLEDGGGSASASSRPTVTDEFVRHCLEREIRSIIQFVPFNDAGCRDVDRRLRESGISVRTVRLGLGESDFHGHLEKVERAGMEAVMRTFSARRFKMPDLVLFRDDFVAFGGFTALSYLGIRVPEQIFAVSFSNRGFGPVYPKTVTRMESDPFAKGRLVAESVVSRLEGRKPRLSAAPTSSYIRGETFP